MTNTIGIEGRLADAKLRAKELTLTQGGEPTCVSCHPVAQEWNVAALGPEKLVHARRMARHLAAELFPGALILLSPGKQYPGEPYPRWQLGLHRSRCGSPLWKDVNRLRLDQTILRGLTPAAARRWIGDLARALRVEDTILPGYEDFEGRLRIQGNEAALRLLPTFSRRRRAFIVRSLPKPMQKSWAEQFRPVGWVLPLDHNGRRWRTEKWKIGAGRDLTLLTGEGPIGMRLPLNRLGPGVLKRALTVEVKDGELLVFLPPLPSFAAFRELVGTIETLAARSQLPPLLLEGYPPPAGPDVETIALTSDPGVIEVNLPPSDNWPEFERLIRGVYRAMERSGLRGYKYQPGGRKTSTGGGAHILLGGPDPKHNPFIQRPTLISSFLRFLQNHPSLSYVFSGLFTGPSCQAPRVDETLHDLPYELEITLRALEQMPRPGDPEQMDAMLRNLLMDWNGNTHRAELSVDKFHNRDAPNGRLGVVEFRAFEMPPTPEMLLAPNALMRSLAACFAEKPYTRPLIDWREALGDRFALPWYLRQDLGRVVRFVNKHGFSFKPGWFEPHLDFRFPVITRFQTTTVKWTLRHALEPWPVMGEHTGTGRVVDGTTDRLELLAQGIAKQSRWAVSVNGIWLPMAPVAHAQAVGAVRYRLLDNPWGLQPQVRSHCPLRFEIVDTQTGRVIHAFDWLHWNQSDPAYRGLPASEEEARRRVGRRVVPRRQRIGRPARLRVASRSPAGRFTLDLRRF